MTTQTHTISYAYPTSPDAVRLKLPDGGYTLQIGLLSTKGYPHLTHALLAVPAGSEPTRWSIDHPANQWMRTK